MAAAPEAVAPVVTPSFHEAFRVWLKIGLLSFGGPAGQIALMHKVLVEDKKWVDEPRFLHGLNFCMVLPGPEAMQLATYIGWLLHGTRGGIMAGVLFVLPGFCLMLALSMAYAVFQSTHWFSSLFFGLKAAVLAIVLEALLRVARKSLKGRAAYAIAGSAFLALFAFQIPFPLVVLGAAFAGVLSFARPHGEERSGSTGNRESSGSIPVRFWFTSISKFAWKSLGVLFVWGALWMMGLLAARMLGAGPGLPFDLALFFSKMAVVTFGGAYAVLAYVAQAAVETFGWLKPGQMIDGLALAETTPGPLILVLSFVGFLAMFQQPGALHPLLAGTFGAVITTWVTFIPCFLWIFLGAPYIEALRKSARLSAALAGIGAGVVGVILNLSIWFALQTLFGRVGTLKAGPLEMAAPDWATLDWPALALCLFAFACLFGLKLGMIRTMAICAALGVAAKAALG